jgi:hypothetical protein
MGAVGSAGAAASVTRRGRLTFLTPTGRGAVVTTGRAVSEVCTGGGGGEAQPPTAATAMAITE